MGKITNRFSVILVALLIVISISCKKKDIKGEQITISNVTLSMKTTAGQVPVPQDSNYSKTPQSVIIPLEISFSDAVPKRFNVGVTVNNDTINQLIAANKLPNTVLLPAEFYQIPSNIDVLFGLDHIDFNLVVDMTAIERNYGKNLALAVVLTDPTKSNKLAPSKNMAIVVINTSKIITPAEIHYISFAGAGNILDIPQPGIIYAQNSSSLTVPVKISLAGIAGSAFNVKVAADTDTVKTVIAADTSLVMLNAGTDFQIPDSVDFLANKNEASFDLNVNVDPLKNNFTKKLVLALTLSDPTSHLLDSLKKTVIIELDPPKLVELDITNKGSIFSVQYENTNPNDQGENSSHLIDNNIYSKFLIFNFTAPAWMQLQYATPQYSGAYTITSANDAPGRDPKSWQILGSNDGINWTVLDQQMNQSFANRYQTNKYVFPNTTAYSYYRLNILANNGDGLFQCAEWRLIRRP
ncbi:MAG TPA: discoidin domain-containing protein [Chitinophagaceae bacterium]